jgi:hypothetical protein
MAERTFKSPGVRAFEIDNSGPTPTGPTGVPAGVIGTAQDGPAFVPVTVANLSEFESKFGFIDGTQFGPIAAQEWLKNASSLTYTRVLGAGNGEKRSVTDGTVTNAGFVAGQEIPLDTGYLGANNQANSHGTLGRVHFLGAYMSESVGSTIFTDSDIQSRFGSTSDNTAVPIIRGVLMAASGVTMFLSSSNPGATATTPKLNSAVSTVIAGADNSRFNMTGSVGLEDGNENFKLLLVGHKGLNFKQNLTASFNPNATNYFGKVFNKDPLAVQQHGYFLYTHYDIYPQYAVVTGSGIISIYADGKGSGPGECAFITTGSQARNAGAADAPNYENFEDRYRAARTPFIVSQKFGGSSQNLFRIHMLSDGVVKGKGSDPAGSNTKYKVSIENVGKSSDPLDKYGSFDLTVRDYYDTDDQQFVYEAYRGLNLDPSSPNYVARRIGDLYTFFDFDRALGSQKVVVEGKYPNISNRIRVEMNSLVEDGGVDKESVPFGFRGLDHIITSGSNALATSGSASNDRMLANGLNLRTVFNSANQPPVPFRENIALGLSPKKVPNKALYWGVQFQKKQLLNEPNKSTASDPTIASFTKFFPDQAVSNLNFSTGSNAGQSDENGYVLDCDRFNNNGFSMENVRVGTGSDGFAISTDTALINSWSYVRGGNIAANENQKTRALKVSDTERPAIRRLVKFTMPFQAGYDGVNILNVDTIALNNNAVIGEMNDASRGSTSGPTVAAYRKALDIMSEKSDADIQLLAVPGIRHSSVTDEAITTVEERFDALYVMDIEERDNLNSVVTSSVQNVNISNTVTSFSDRALDTSFAAAFFPDINSNVTVKTLNNTTRTVEAQQATVRVPPSVGVLGALSFNDSVAFPWFAPAGFARGALNAESTAVSLNNTNLDDLNGKDINPIIAFPGSSGPVIFGQRTLQAAASALDRINVRRLLIDVRRAVKQVAEQLIFEPNRESTLQRFSALVNPILQRVQENQGLDRFKVIIDSSTTTQVDIENNTVRGKIFLQPTRTAEFISLDFVVTNAGVEGL